MNETITCQILKDKNGNHFYPLTSVDCVADLGAAISGITADLGSLASNNSCSLGKVISINLCLSGVTVSAATETTIVSLPTAIKPATKAALSIQTAQSEACGYVDTTGAIKITSANALAGSDVYITGVYPIN